MSKRPKKKHANRKSSSFVKGAGTGADTPASLVSELESAILQLRGRRSMVLARQLKPEVPVPGERREKLVAAAHEAYVRELLDGGHTGSAQDHARSFAGKEPGLCRHWALSLQVRLGLVADLERLAEDVAWRERLRLELVDPGDLVDCPIADYSTDAHAVNGAWQAADSGQLQAARALIAGIGRRSLLVDWRLFVQAGVAAREGNAEEMEAALARIMPGTSAAHLGQALKACLHQDRAALAGTDLASQLASPPPELVDHVKALSTALLKSRGKSAILCKSLKTLLAALLQAKRPSAAHLVLASTCKERFDTTLLDAAYDAGLPVSCVHLCGAMINLPMDEWGDEFDELLRHGNWSPQERALLLLEQAKDMRQMLESEDDDAGCFDEDDEDECRQDIQKWCRDAAGSWPGLRDIYATWSWAERLGKTHYAETAETRAFPSDPQAWGRLVCRLAVLAKFKECDKAMAVVAALPGTLDVCNRLTGYIAFQKVCDADRRNLPFENLQVLASAYNGDNLFEQVDLATRLWLKADSNARKRERGAVLTELGHPWLAAVFCHELSNERITASQVPANLKKTMLENPAVVADDFILLAQHPDRARINWQHSSLVKALLAALADPHLSPLVLQECLYHLLLGNWHQFYMRLVTDYAPSMIEITARLLDSGDRPSSTAIAALAFRALLYEEPELQHGLDHHGVAITLLRAAKQLASDTQIKGIVREVEDKTGLLMRPGVDTKSAIDALSVWRQQCTIKTSMEFWKHFSSVNQSSGVRHMAPAERLPLNPFDDLARILGTPFEDENWDHWEDDDDLDEPPVKQTRKKPGKKTSSPGNKTGGRLDLNKCFPTSETEFEILISKVAFSGGINDKVILHDKIKDSCLPEKAKERLFTRLEGTIGEKGRCPF